MTAVENANIAIIAEIANIQFLAMPKNQSRFLLSQTPTDLIT
jgi:hypothetical protein